MGAESYLNQMNNELNLLRKAEKMNEKHINKSGDMAFIPFPREK